MGRTNIDDWNVVIVLSDPSMGGRASTGVKSISAGFDWESGRINIQPETAIVRKTNPLQVATSAEEQNMRKDIVSVLERFQNEKLRTARAGAEIFRIIDRYKTHS